MTNPSTKEKWQKVKEALEALALRIVTEPGVEADDVIGTLAEQATRKGFDVVIVSGDKDMMQLVNENVVLINTMTDTLSDEQGVVDKFGVRADQIVDWLALVGDSADNIPEVRGVGPVLRAGRSDRIRQAVGAEEVDLDRAVERGVEGHGRR